MVVRARNERWRSKAPIRRNKKFQQKWKVRKATSYQRMAARMMSFSSSSSRDEVYVAAIPLRASKGLPHLIMSTAYSLNFPDLQHLMVVHKPNTSCSPIQQQLQDVTVYDFQPEDPESIWVAAAALSGRKVAGVILQRKLPYLPKRKCWFVGYAKGDAADTIHKFNHDWETDLVLGHHDCRHYAQGLVEHLTGNKAVRVWRRL